MRRDRRRLVWVSLGAAAILAGSPVRASAQQSPPDPEPPPAAQSPPDPEPPPARTDEL
jgi:hypothetical protein